MQPLARHYFKILRVLKTLSHTSYTYCRANARELARRRSLSSPKWSTCIPRIVCITSHRLAYIPSIHLASDRQRVARISEREKGGATTRERCSNAITRAIPASCARSLTRRTSRASTPPPFFFLHSSRLSLSLFCANPRNRPAAATTTTMTDPRPAGRKCINVIVMLACTLVFMNRTHDALRTARKYLYAETDVLYATRSAFVVLGNKEKKKVEWISTCCRCIGKEEE